MKKLECHVDEFVGQWLSDKVAPAADATDLLKTIGFVFHKIQDGNNWVNHEGSRHLDLAAVELLKQTGETQRVSKSTAVDAIVDGLFDHMPKALLNGQFSEHAIVSRALKTINTAARDDGTYVLPIVFAPLAKDKSFRVGPVKLVPKEKLNDQLSAQLTKFRDGDEHQKWIAQKWDSYIATFDHFACVDIQNHESGMAWPVAKQVAEFALNLVRVTFGYQLTRNIKLGGEFSREQTSSNMTINPNGEIGFLISEGPWGSHLGSDWTEGLDREFGTHAELLSSLASWMASGNDLSSPVLERLKYANSLLADAYCEPYHYIRIVRLISTLETLALLPKEEKASNLSYRCSCVGSWGDHAVACEIYDATKAAYRIRNAVVHGDAPSDDDILQAFLALERHIPSIFLGYLSVYCTLQNRHKPTSVRQLRRIFGERFHFMAWDPSLV